MASYPFKGAVSDMAVAGGMLYATVKDDGVYLFGLDAKDFYLQGYYPLTSSTTRITVHKGTAYLAGASAITALTPLAGLSTEQKDAAQISISFPPYTPLGSYSLMLGDMNGDSSLAANALQVSMPRFSRPKITPEEFERLLQEQRVKNQGRPP